jgi:NADH-quinone oxidoreductase subunit J
VDFVALRQGFVQYLPFSAVVGLIVLVELLLVGSSWVIAPEILASPHVPIDASVTNTEALGHVLYTKYVYFFQAAGLVLIVAMIGAIVLTLRHKTGVKRQDPARQSARTKAEAMEIRKVQSGQGL